MDLYTQLRHFADSWMLLTMTVIFVGIVVYALRPGSKPIHDDIADIPLRNDGVSLHTAETRAKERKESRHG